MTVHAILVQPIESLRRRRRNPLTTHASANHHISHPLCCAIFGMHSAYRAVPLKSKFILIWLNAQLLPLITRWLSFERKNMIAFGLAHNHIFSRVSISNLLLCRLWQMRTGATANIHSEKQRRNGKWNPHVPCQRIPCKLWFSFSAECMGWRAVRYRVMCNSMPSRSTPFFRTRESNVKCKYK